MHPRRIAPPLLAHRVVGRRIEVRGQLKPFAQVVLENWQTKELGTPVTCDARGGFLARVVGSVGAPFVVHALEPVAVRPGAPRGARLEAVFVLTGLAGSAEPVVLSEVLSRGPKAPPELRLARMGVAGERVIADRAVTPGSLVSVLNESSEPTSEFHSVASAVGSFVLPADLHLDDILRIELLHPPRRQTDGITRARAQVRAEGGCGGCCGLWILAGFGDYERVQVAPEGPVEKAEPIERIVWPKQSGRAEAA